MEQRLRNQTQLRLAERDEIPEGPASTDIPEAPRAEDARPRIQKSKKKLTAPKSTQFIVESDEERVTVKTTAPNVPSGVRDTPKVLKSRDSDRRPDGNLTLRPGVTDVPQKSKVKSLCIIYGLFLSSAHRLQSDQQFAADLDRNQLRDIGRAMDTVTYMAQQNLSALRPLRDALKDVDVAQLATDFRSCIGAIPTLNTIDIGARRLADEVGAWSIVADTQGCRIAEIKKRLLSSKGDEGGEEGYLSDAGNSDAGNISGVDSHHDGMELE